MTRTRGEEEENKVYLGGPFGVGGGRTFTREEGVKLSKEERGRESRTLEVTGNGRYLFGTAYGLGQVAWQKAKAECKSQG